MKHKKYEQELRRLQIKLCLLQEWMVHAGLRVIVVFEGRDAKVKLPDRVTKGTYDDQASLEGRTFVPEPSKWLRR